MSRVPASLTSAGAAVRGGSAALVRSAHAWLRVLGTRVRPFGPRLLSFAVDLALMALFIGLWLVVFIRGAVLSP